MITKTQQRALAVYASLMEEVKLRMTAIDYCTMLNFRVHPAFVQEFCYMQLRMICELIALGCLVAHGDIEETTSKKMQKEWSAERIIATLAALHAEFYPLPVKQAETITAIPSPLPKEAFLSLYRKCGEMLHRGNLQTLERPRRFDDPMLFANITAIAQKIENLLAGHVLVMRNMNQMFYCRMRLAVRGGGVQVVMMETPDGRPFSSAFVRREF